MLLRVQSIDIESVSEDEITLAINHYVATDSSGLRLYEIYSRVPLDESLDAIKQQLSDESHSQRESAMHKVAYMRADVQPLTQDVLASVRKHGYSTSSEHAVLNLSRYMPRAEAIPILIECLGATDSRDIAKTMATGTGALRVHLAAILTSCRRIHPHWVPNTAHLLYEIGEESIPHAVKNLGHDEPAVRRCASATLALFGQRSMAASTPVLDDKNDQVRLHAVKAVSLMPILYGQGGTWRHAPGSMGVETAERMSPALGVGPSAEYAEWERKVQAERKAIFDLCDRPLLKALADTDERTRVAAVQGLAHEAFKSGNATQRLVDVYKADKSEKVRNAIVDTLQVLDRNRISTLEGRKGGGIGLPGRGSPRVEPLPKPR